VATEKILGATLAELGDALAPGGMVPELRAFRMKTIATKVRDEFGNDLSAALRRSPGQARKVLKSFSNIGNAGADRIVLFARLAPVAAIPSNCPHVLVRILFGKERPNYGVTYGSAQDIVAADVPEKFGERARAYLLLKRHGQEICKTKPRCETCPMSADCAYFADQRRKTRAAG
jgi:endonuclease III